MATLLGFDASHHNGVIDWDKVESAGCDFAICKATEGTTYVDSQFDRNRLEAARVGVAFGAYHFLRPELDASLQALHFMSVYGKVRPGEIGFACDVEAAFALDDEEQKRDLWLDLPVATRRLKVGHFLAPTDEKLGRGMVYTAPGWWDSVIGADADFSGHGLWIADPSHAEPRLCGCWKTFKVHQYSWTGSLSGVGSGAVDLDRWPQQ